MRLQNSKRRLQPIRDRRFVAGALLLVFAAVALILWVSLRSSGAIMRLVGKGGIEAISRLMGFLLVCMGVQFVINGVLEIVSSYHG